MAVKRGLMFSTVLVLMIGILAIMLALSVWPGRPSQETTTIVGDWWSHSGGGNGGDAMAGAIGVGGNGGNGGLFAGYTPGQDPIVGTWKISRIVNSDKLEPDQYTYNAYKFTFNISNGLSVTKNGTAYDSTSYQKVAFAGDGKAWLGNQSFAINNGYDTRGFARVDDQLLPDYIWSINGTLYGTRVINTEFRIVEEFTKIA